MGCEEWKDYYSIIDYILVCFLNISFVGNLVVIKEVTILEASHKRLTQGNL